MKTLKRFSSRLGIYIAVCVSALLIAKPVLAGCTGYNDYDDRVAIGGNITMPVDTPIGGVFKTDTFPINGKSSCTAGTKLQNNYTYYFTVNNDVIIVGGVGLRIKVNGNAFGYPGTAYTATPLPKPLSGATLTIEYIRVSPGSISTTFPNWGGLATIKEYNGSAIYTIDLYGGWVKTSSCTVNSQELVFPLGDTPSNQFTAVGSTPSEFTQNLVLQCTENANIKATFSGTKSTETSNTSILGLTSPAAPTTAKGVGVQIVYNNAPLTIGGGFTLAQGAVAGQMVIPLTARYYQTQSTVTMGTANASATLNLTYQ